jgi:hypothetical protein
VKVEVFPHRQLAVKSVLLADDPQDLFRKCWMCHDVDSTDECLPGGRDDAGSQDSGSRCFPSAIGAEEAEDLPSANGETEFVDSPKVRAFVDLGQIDGADGVVGRARRIGEWADGSIGHGSVQATPTAESREMPGGDLSPN